MTGCSIPNSSRSWACIGIAVPSAAFVRGELNMAAAGSFIQRSQSFQVLATSKGQ